MKVALTIASTDSSSGAGVTADLLVFRKIGIYGVCAVATVTAQNSTGVQRVCKLPPAILAAQIDSVTRDFEIGSCKIGMIYSPAAVELIAARIIRRDIQNVVLDPVMNAKNGEVLLTEPAIKKLKKKLLPKVTLITPNAYEAKKLTGIDVVDIDSAKEAAKILVGMGSKYALIKGGHIEGEPIDILFDGDSFIEYRGKRLDKSMHGTGCVLSAAICARIALGDTVAEAVLFAKDFVSNAIENSLELGKKNLFYYCY